MTDPPKFPKLPQRDMRKRLELTVSDDGRIDLTEEDGIESGAERICVLEADTLQVVRYDDLPETGDMRVGENRAGDDVVVLVFY